MDTGQSSRLYAVVCFSSLRFSDFPKEHQVQASKTILVSVPKDTTPRWHLRVAGIGLEMMT